MKATCWETTGWMIALLGALLAPFMAAQSLHAAEAATAPTFDVAAYGAVADGTTLNTTSIQKAIDACGAKGGGTIRFPPGRYLTGTIQLKNNVTLHLDEQAILLGSTNPADYRNLDPFTAGDGVSLGFALIIAVDATHIGLEGAGTIDGQGAALKAAQSRYTVRPFLVRFLRCEDVTVKDIHLTSPGAWTLNFFQTRNGTIEHVTIRSRGLVNNDGIDLDSCESIHIRGCDIDSGDDALCLKATSTKPCRDITATDCKLKTACNGIKLGTESLGDFEKISITNCDLRDIGMAGIALYCVDGAHLTDVAVKDITMNGVTVPIAVRLGARLKTFRAGDVAKPVGIIRNIAIDNVQATGVKLIGLLINGVPDHPVEAVSLSNIHVELPGGGTAAQAQVQLPEKENAYPEYSMFGRVTPSYGLYLRHVDGVTFKDVTTTLAKPDARSAVVFIDVKGVTPKNYGPSTQPIPNP